MCVCVFVLSPLYIYICLPNLYAVANALVHFASTSSLQTFLPAGGFIYCHSLLLRASLLFAFCISLNITAFFLLLIISFKQSKTRNNLLNL